MLPICRRIDKRDAPHQARDVFSCARVVLNFAVEKGVLASSPLLGARYGKPGKPRTRRVEEVRTFWTKLDTAPLQNDFKTIMRLQLLLGRRVSEVAGIKRREINMDARLWTFLAERCKNGRELKVPITKMARAIIGELLSRGKGQLLIPNALGNPHDAKHSAKALAAAQDHFAFKTSFTTHDLRRSCGTFLPNWAVFVY
jgi:integrase